ncbi:MAG: hypothetical protein Q4A40_07290, partial [Bacillota bacterium]|nr:hypothetical protein [Bacillota bacterium]
MKGIISAAGAVMIIAVMLMLGGCGEPTKATLEDIAASNTEISKTISEGIEVPAGTTAKVTFSGDSFDVTYTFDESMDSDLEKRLVSSFDENSGALKEGCEASIADLQKQTEISGITGTIHFLNQEGKEVWAV